MFKLQDMLKEEDGYHIVTIHAKDTAFREAIVFGMQAKGYETYSFSQHEDDSIQYAFVTAEMKKVLHERHLRSVRNSLGSAEEVLGKKPGLIDGIVGRMRARLGKREQVDDFIVLHPAPEVDPNVETSRTYSELRAGDLERKRREGYPPREAPTRPLPRDEHHDYSRPSRLSDDDDYSRRSSPVPISDPSPSSYDGGSSDGGGSD